MRSFVRALDAALSRHYGVFEFNDDPECILRLQFSHANRLISLPEIDIQPGQPVLMIHLWNNKLPRMPVEGANLAWAKEIQRKFVYSLTAVAKYMERIDELSTFQAIGGITALLQSDQELGGNKLMHRLGFTILPSPKRLGRFGEFWENFYSMMLIWTYNPTSFRSSNRRKVLILPRSEIWISRIRLFDRYG